MNLNETLTLLSGIFALVSLGLFFLEYQTRRRAEEKLKNLEQVAPARAIKTGQGLLHRAIQKAQAIIGQAELEGVKITAASKFETRELETELEKQMVKTVESEVHEALTKFNDKLSASSDAELAQMHLEIANYKAKRLAAIDQKAVDVLEAVIPRVLAKNLKVADQMELINQAIEQAKADNFF